MVTLRFLRVPWDPPQESFALGHGTLDRTERRVRCFGLANLLPQLSGCESHLEKAGPQWGLQADCGSQGGGLDKEPPLLLIHQPKGPSVGLSGSGSGRKLFLNTPFCKVLRTMARTNAFEKLKESSLYYIRIIIFLLAETPRVNEAQTGACKMTGAVSERVTFAWKPPPGPARPGQQISETGPTVPDDP